MIGDELILSSIRSDISGLFALLDGLPLGAYVFRLDDAERAASLRILFANRASGDMLGHEPTAVAGRSIGDVFPNSLGPGGPAESYRAVIVSQQPRDLGVISYADDRLQGRFTVSAYPVTEDTVVLLFENLSTESARVTELAAIVDSTDDAILSQDLDGTILTWNPAAERLYGYAAAEAVGRPVSMLLPAGRAGETAEVLGRLAAGERIEQFVSRHVRKTGATVDVALTVSAIRNTDGVVVGTATIAHDVRAENEAAARAQQLAAIVDSTDDAIFSRTTAGVITSWNAGAEALFGYTADEVIGRPLQGLLAGDDPELAEIGERLNRGERLEPIELAMRTKDGSEVIVSSSAAPIKDITGRVTGVSAVVRDVTEQRHLETQLRQAQKLESIGSLAGGVAHDLSNILTVIRTANETVLRELGDARLRGLVRQADLAAEHAATLTGQLLAFSRQQVLRPEPTYLNAVLRTTLDLAGRLLGANIHIETDLATDLDLVNIDRGQLQQVILNLSINARDAMPDGGVLEVRTSNVLVDSTFTERRPEIAPGPHVVLEITDSGVGMDEATRDRIFDPFFTTKAEGTGLGLATVYGIVKQSGGQVWIYSEPGLGSTFKIYFPATLDHVTRPRPKPVVERLDGDETILLVEDAEMLRPLVGELLESYGYRVLVGADGEEALALLRAHHGPIDLLLTDMVLPGMNGRELSERLLGEHPETKVLFTSGYAADASIQRGIPAGGFSFIQKPYLGAELLTKIRETLG